MQSNVGKIGGWRWILRSFGKEVCVRESQLTENSVRCVGVEQQPDNSDMSLSFLSSKKRNNGNPNQNQSQNWDQDQEQDQEARGGVLWVAGQM